MPNNTGLAGGQPQKQVRFAPIYTGRISSGIWTNRSPLRDAATSRIVEKFYGPAGDAMIAGSNVEVSNKLTLIRRPGLTPNSSNNYTNPDRFYEFRLFNPTTEEIILMIDQINTLYSELGGVKSTVFNKSTGAGQAYMQSVGNILYFGDGVDNKKWLQTLYSWSSGAQWGVAGTPFFTTYLIDPNGNLQQLTGTVIPVTNVSISSGILTITSSLTLTNLLSIGVIVTFPSGMTASFLDNQNVTITGVSGSTFTANFSHSNYSGTESGINAVAVGGGTPISGGSTPSWSTTVPSSGNDFQGGITIDGSVQWTNRGNPIENWGIKPPTQVLTPTLGPAFNANWAANTFYSIASVIIDTNGNLQQVTTSGTAGSSAPTWNTSPGGTTTDGTVTWTLIETASQLNWVANTAYVPPITINSVAGSIGSSAVYTGIVTGGASNALAGNTYLITGFPDLANNGIFLCTASSTTTLTLSNANAVAQNATEVGLAVQQNTIQYVLGNAAGVNSLFKLTPSALPTLVGNVSAYLYAGPTSGPVGSFTLTYPTSTGSALASYTSLNSLQFAGAPLGTGATLTWDTINGAGETTGTTIPFPSYTNSYQLIILATLNIQQAGNYTFNISHHDGMIWGIGGGATLISGTSYNPIGQTQTAANGYPIFGGTNAPGLEGGGSYDPTTNTWSGAPVYDDTFVVNFATPGQYTMEFNYSYWYHSGQQFTVQINGQSVPNGTPISGNATPSWPGFSTSYAPNYATAQDGALTWSNIGPATDYIWAASKGFTLPSTIITDTNGYFEAPFRSGYTSSTKPTFNTGLNSLTNDNPNLIWINEGLASSLPSGSLSTFNGGWEYCLALVNSLDNTVSNCTPLSASTGNFVGLSSINLAPGDGLPALANIDPQCDYVDIFRTTDGGATPFLIPGVNNEPQYTISLADYIQNGYTDTTPDTGLNNLISGAINGENTPPGKGAKNLTYHLNRIFYSIGNVVYWTTGPAAPVGNGLNGTAPANFDQQPSLVTRIVPTAVGALVFTVSDIFIIQGSGTSGSPIQSAIPFEPGIGLLSYNALDTNGPLIGFFTTDNQFLILDPSSGVSYAGFPIGDQLRLSNPLIPGQNWNPSDVYVAWHVQGEDQAWYVCDGKYGWFKLMATPAPETGFTWSPFAAITGGAGAVQSIEITPGVHRLLVGPTGTGEILQRNLDVFTDNGTPYPAYAVFGSIVLAQPGQTATVVFVTTDSVRVGSPITLGILIDEALPYYTGPVETLKKWVNDPPTLRPSKSFWRQRFYLSESQDDAAVMRNCQLQINFASTDTVQNELQTFTIFGSYNQEI
jgi:hypothetical protein